MKINEKEKELLNEELLESVRFYADNFGLTNGKEIENIDKIIEISELIKKLNNK